MPEEKDKIEDPVEEAKEEFLTEPEKEKQFIDVPFDPMRKVDELIVNKISGMSAVRAYRTTSNQMIATGTSTKLQLNIVSYDIGEEFDITTNYRFTAKKAGYYLIVVNVTWGNSVDQKNHYVGIRKNGATALNHKLVSSGTTWFVQSYSDILLLNPNDYIEVYVEQDTGGNADVNAGESATILAIHQIK